MKFFNRVLTRPRTKIAPCLAGFQVFRNQVPARLRPCQTISPRIPAASVFFTVTLAARGSDNLVQYIDALRAAVRAPRAERPFAIKAWVVLPDHMHCVWQLPMGDSDYSTRMGAIKARFSMSLRRSGFTPTYRRVRWGYGKNGFGNITSAMRPSFKPLCGIVGSIR